VAPPKKKTTFASFRWLLLLPIPALWCVLAHFGGLTFFENKFVDWQFRLRGEIDAPVNIVYVDVDSRSLSEIGGSPWSRSYFARVCAALIEQGHVESIGIDMVFSENGVAEAIDWKKRVEGNREFARYLTKSPSVVLAASYAAATDRDINGKLITRELPTVRGKSRPGTGAELPELPSFRLNEKDQRRQWSPALIGLIDTMDGATRTVPAFVKTDVRPYLHLAVELARLHYGVAPDGVHIADDFVDLTRADGTLARRIPLRDGQFIDLNWFSKWNSVSKNPRVSFSTVYAYAEMLKSEKPEEKKAAEDFFGQPDFKNAIVLIGPVDPLLQDLAATPFDDVPVPKVGVHGNVVKTIVSGKFLRQLPRFGGIAWTDYAVVFLLTVIVSGLASAGGARSLVTKAGSLLTLVAYVAFAFWLFKSNQWVLPLAAPVGAALMTSFAGVIWQLIEEEKQKGRIKGMFGTYVSPQLVDRMVESGESPQLGGHDDEITAYFSDIQSFSTFSEKLGSGPLVELMNEYLTACTDIVQAEGGTLDKYIGDAVVAMFGAPIALPDHAYRACVASQLVHRKLGELREKWKSEGAKWPEIVWNMQTRVGLNTGMCMIGNMGSRTRFNYTMMGDNVNLAARMESGSKAYGVYTMVAEATKLACEKHGDRVVFRYLDRIVVKGRTTAVPVYEIVGLKEHVAPSTHECLGVFAQGVERYLAQDWDVARTFFERSSAVEPNIPGKTPGVESNPSIVMVDRCDYMKQHPPGAGWDGVYTMKSK
jgi:adenylate cyclase